MSRSLINEDPASFSVACREQSNVYPVYSYMLRHFNIVVFNHRVNSLQLRVSLWVIKFEKITGCFLSAGLTVRLCEPGVWDYVADGR